MTPQSFLLLCSLSLFSACTGEITGDDFHGDEQDLGNIQITTQRVRDFETSTCSTASVAALSRQIAEEMLCMAPGVVSKLEAQGGLSFTSSAVLPYMEAEAAQDLMDAAAEVPIILNSGFRTVVQQYLLRKWFERGRCGIPSAARPGRSNHESGRAIDVANRAQAKSALRRHGWRDPLPRDPVHFEHRSSPDMRGLDVHAFQRLWNRNNPSDTISEDGEYGPNTESRLRKSPAAGFSIGPSCAGSDAANWVGDSCESDVGCELPNDDGSCSSWFDANSDQLQGMCTSSCNGVCPQRSGERTSFCADTGQSEGLCVPQSVGGSEGCLGVTGSRLLPLRRFEQNGLRSKVQTVCAPPQTAAISCQSDNRPGECIDTDVSECPGDLVHGVCPGGNSIRCCLQ